MRFYVSQDQWAKSRQNRWDGRNEIGLTAQSLREYGIFCQRIDRTRFAMDICQQIFRIRARKKYIFKHAWLLDQNQKYVRPTSELTSLNYKEWLLAQKSDFLSHSFFQNEEKFFDQMYKTDVWHLYIDCIDGLKGARAAGEKIVFSRCVYKDYKSPDCRRYPACGAYAGRGGTQYIEDYKREKNINERESNRNIDTFGRNANQEPQPGTSGTRFRKAWRARSPGLQRSSFGRDMMMPGPWENRNEDFERNVDTRNEKISEKNDLGLEDISDDASDRTPKLVIDYSDVRTDVDSTKYPEKDTQSKLIPRTKPKKRVEMPVYGPNGFEVQLREMDTDLESESNDERMTRLFSLMKTAFSTEDKSTNSIKNSNSNPPSVHGECTKRSSDSLSNITDDSFMDSIKSTKKSKPCSADGKCLQQSPSSLSSITDDSFTNSDDSFINSDANFKSKSVSVPTHIICVQSSSNFLSSNTEESSLYNLGEPELNINYWLENNTFSSWPDSSNKDKNKTGTPVEIPPSSSPLSNILNVTSSQNLHQRPTAASQISDKVKNQRQNQELLDNYGFELDSHVVFDYKHGAIPVSSIRTSKPDHQWVPVSINLYSTSEMNNGFRVSPSPSKTTSLTPGWSPAASTMLQSNAKSQVLALGLITPIDPLESRLGAGTISGNNTTTAATDNARTTTASPPSDPRLRRNPPSDPRLRRNPPSDPRLRRNPPSDPRLRRNPPLDPRLRRNPPSDPRLRRSPPSDPRLRRSPRSDPKPRRLLYIRNANQDISGVPTPVLIPFHLGPEIAVSGIPNQKPINFQVPLPENPLPNQSDLFGRSQLLENNINGISSIPIYQAPSFSFVTSDNQRSTHILPANGLMANQPRSATAMGHISPNYSLMERQASTVTNLGHQCPPAPYLRSQPSSVATSIYPVHESQPKRCAEEDYNRGSEPNRNPLSFPWRIGNQHEKHIFNGTYSVNRIPGKLKNLDLNAVPILPPSSCGLKTSSPNKLMTSRRRREGNTYSTNETTKYAPDSVCK